MLFDLIWTFLISISPFGEGRVGIPYAIKVGEFPIWFSFLLGLTSNLLVFPMFYAVIRYSNRVLWSKRFYKKSSVYFSRRAKKKVGGSVNKYGFWGLMVLVMIPLPGTGAYIGTIVAFVLGMDYKKSFLAVSLGVAIACLIITSLFYLETVFW